MANRSASSRRTRASTVQSSSLGVFPSVDGTGYTVFGSTLTAQTVISTSTTAAGAATTTTAINPPVTNFTITSIQYTDAGYYAINPTANAAVANQTSTIRIFGTGFANTAQVYLDGNVTGSYYNSTTELRVPIPSGATNTANTLMVFNSNSVGAIYAPGVQWRTPPVWSAYSLTTASTTISYQLAASGATRYTLTGTLPGGLTLNSATGLITGTLTSSTFNTYTFDVTAYNLYGQGTPQTVTIIYGVLYAVNYFAVGAGGAGASGGAYAGQNYRRGGGGGGSGGVVYGATNIQGGTSYVVTIGAGAAGSCRALGFNGANTTVIGTGLALTARGGGGGGSGIIAGTPGGSGGGGGGIGNSGGTGGSSAGGCGTQSLQVQTLTGPGSSSVNAGSVGSSGSNWPGPGAAGGGAGGGTSGIGNPFNPGTLYAGGGAGGNGTGVALNGGTGGGGPGGYCNRSGGNATNYGAGGGGGGGGDPAQPFSSPTPVVYPGGNGYGGLVALAVPNTYYSNRYTGNVTISNPPAAPGQTVLTWDTSGTYTA